MGKIVVSMNLSLDGYIEARGEDDGSWLSIDGEVHRFFNALASRAELFLYGRKVYEVMIPYWPDAAEGTENPDYEREYGRLWVKTPKLVVSTSLTDAGYGTRVISSDVAEELARLKHMSQGEILCYGGAELVSLLEAHELLDEYVLFVHPATLGAGKPLFQRPSRLHLEETRHFESGVVCLRYTRAT